MSLQTMVSGTEIPSELKRAVSSLDNPIRWRIVEILSDRQELSYTELIESLHIKKGQLTYHLNELLKGAVLENYSKDGLESKYDSYYAISHFGKSLLKSVVETLQPKPVTLAVFKDIFVSSALSASVGLFFTYGKPSFFTPPADLLKSSLNNLEQFYARLADVSPLPSILSSAGKEIGLPAQQKLDLQVSH